MSLLKKIGIGTGIGVVVLGLGYLGYKKLRGKKEEDVEVVIDLKDQKDNIQKYYDDLVDSAKLTKEEVDELANKHFNKK